MVTKRKKLKNYLTPKTKHNRHKASFARRVNLSTLCINTFCVFLKKSLSTHLPSTHIPSLYLSQRLQHYTTSQHVCVSLNVVGTVYTYNFFVECHRH